MATFAGVDFSGDAGKWSPGCSKSNVWVAEGTVNDEGKRLLLELRRVQALPGTDPPFQRLSRYLCENGFTAVALDAPFSVPAKYLPSGSHAELLSRVGGFQRGHERRPFAGGVELVNALLPGNQSPKGLKVYRKTEDMWRRRGIAVRSTLWNGPRGGAPFTVACLTLLRATGLPLWPWCELPGRQAGPRTILAEAFPAAQLRTWGLPYVGYSKDEPKQRETRIKILQGIKQQGKLTLSPSHAEVMVSDPDALDAVLCVYAAMAARKCKRRWVERHYHFMEGLIAVHR